MTDVPRTGSRRAATAAAGSFERRPPAADPWAAALLIVAGLAALAQLVLPWRAVGPGSGGPAAALADSDAARAIGSGGWAFYRALHDLPGPTFELTLARFVVLGTAGAGLALVLLGLLSLAPMDHRPLGSAALVVSGAAALGAVFLLARARSLFGVGLNALFSQAQTGFYLLLVAGLIGLAGAFKALGSR